jgi:hypothetical protein
MSMKQTTGSLILVLAMAIAFTSLPVTALAASREVMLEDLEVGEIQNDLYHRAARPGKVVRVVPWMSEDGRYTLLAVTETGWVYQTEADPTSWKLVGRIFPTTGAGGVRPPLD